MGLLFTLSVNGVLHAKELVFQANFSSEYPEYPHANNKQRGTAYTYKKNNDTSSRQRFKKLASAQLKNAVLSNSTNNPFKSAYSYAYTPKNKNKIRKCPALSFPFELDNNKATKEWLISSSLYLCLSSKGYEIDSIPHMWILQRKAGRYRILMEADGYIKIIGNSLSNYDDILAYIYLSRTRRNGSNLCGGPMNMWTYSNGRYVVANADYHSDDCDFKNATGSRWVQWNKRFINAAKPESKRIMRLIQKNQERQGKRKKQSGKQVAQAAKSVKSLLDIISIEEINKLLGK